MYVGYFYEHAQNIENRANFIFGRKCVESQYLKMFPPGGADSSAERLRLVLSVEVERPPLAVPALSARLERLENREYRQFQSKGLFSLETMLFWLITT